MAITMEARLEPLAPIVVGCVHDGLRCHLRLEVQRNGMRLSRQASSLPASRELRHVQSRIWTIMILTLLLSVDQLAAERTP